MAFSFEDISINTIIGSDSFVSGNIKINGFVRVDGDIDGKIEASGNVIIGNKARVRGNISASSIVVGGIVVDRVACTLIGVDHVRQAFLGCPIRVVSDVVDSGFKRIEIALVEQIANELACNLLVEVVGKER